MKEKIFINARIIDPSQNMDEKGSLILNDKGKVKAIGKNVKKTDANKDAEVIDLKGNVLIPGLVDMKAFVGEPGYEYKENFRTLSQAALAGGVTSIVTMPNTKPIIDNVSMVDFIIRRGRDKANVNLFPCASITKQCEGKLMTEFGLLAGRGIIGFSDVNKTIQNTDLMSRVMNYASDLDVLILSGKEDAAGGFGSGPKKLHKILSSKTSNCTLKLYDDMRHEILNEPSRNIVYDDVLHYLINK